MAFTTRLDYMARMNNFAGRSLAFALALAFAVAIASVMLFFGASVVRATEWSDTQYSRVRLVSESSALGDGKKLLMGVEIATRPGWKTYWRAAGEAGLPPNIEWRTAENTSRPKILWPAPERFTADGADSYGYTGGVVLPFFATPLHTGEPVRIAMQLDYAVCLDICVPEQAELSITLEPGSAEVTAHAGLLRDALAQVPVLQGENASPRIIGVQIAAAAEPALMNVTATSDRPFVQPDLFVDGAPDFLFSAPKISLSQDKRSAVFIVAVQSLHPELSLGGHAVTLTLVDSGQAVEHRLRLPD